MDLSSLALLFASSSALRFSSSSFRFISARFSLSLTASGGARERAAAASGAAAAAAADDEEEGGAHPVKFRLWSGEEKQDGWSGCRASSNHLVMMVEPWEDRQTSGTGGERSRSYGSPKKYNMIRGPPPRKGGVTPWQTSESNAEQSNISFVSQQLRNKLLKTSRILWATHTLHVQSRALVRLAPDHSPKPQGVCCLCRHNITQSDPSCDELPRRVSTATHLCTAAAPAPATPCSSRSATARPALRELSWTRLAFSSMAAARARTVPETALPCTVPAVWPGPAGAPAVTDNTA